jgi:hypothetical protein
MRHDSLLVNSTNSPVAQRLGRIVWSLGMIKQVPNVMENQIGVSYLLHASDFQCSVRAGHASGRIHLVLGKRGVTAAFTVAGVSLLLQATPTAGSS